MHIGQYFRSSALMRERCQLVRLTHEITQLLFSPPTKSREPDLQQTGRNLMLRMEQWLDLLPVDLQFHEALPAPIYELQ